MWFAWPNSAYQLSDLSEQCNRDHGQDLDVIGTLWLTDQVASGGGQKPTASRSNSSVVRPGNRSAFMMSGLLMAERLDHVCADLWRLLNVDNHLKQERQDARL